MLPSLHGAALWGWGSGHPVLLQERGWALHAPAVLPSIDALGALLERAWSRRDRDEDAFSAVVMETLAARPPLATVDVEALVDALLDPERPVPRQLAPLGAFGQPGATVFHGRGFVIDVYFWTHALSAIHDHPFRGVFTVLRGHSVEARYRFDEARAPSARVRLGRLSLDALRRIEPGRIEPFGGVEGPRVHALLHVPVPTVSMVVRTVRTDGYLRYFPPGLALAMQPADDAFERPLALLELLRASGDPSFERRAEALFAAADLETTVRALSRLGADSRWLDVASARHGAETMTLVEAALREARVTHEADQLRARLADADDRFVATGLVLADGRASLLRLLGEVHADPLRRLHRFVDEAAGFAEDEAASAHIAHALVDGLGPGGARERLVETFGAEAVAGHHAEIHAYATTGPFARLARP